MKCKEFINDIIPYQKGEVNSSLKEEMGSHLSKCADCREELNISKEMAEVLHNVDVIKRDDYFWNALYGDIRNFRIGYRIAREKYRSESYVLSFWDRFLKPALIGFSFGLLLFLSFLYYDLKSGGLLGKAEKSITSDEIEFYINEHSLSENGNIFSQEGLTSIFVSVQE